jgi:hypothetical protein
MSLVPMAVLVAVDLKGAHTLLADQRDMRDPEPVFQRLIRVLKDCAGQVIGFRRYRVAGWQSRRQKSSS